MTALRMLVLAGLAAPATSSIAADAPELKARPNAAVHVSGALLNALLQRQVDRTEPVEENILGTQYYGWSRTCAQVRVELLPDASRASLDLILAGAAHSRETGYRGSIVVYTQTAIPFEVRKRIAADSKQIRAQPAHASARAESELLNLTNIQGEQHTLAALMGRAVAALEKGDSEAIAASRAERRLSMQFDEEVNSQLARAVQSLSEGLKTARKLGLFPRPFDWSTSADKLHLLIAVPAPGQPAVSLPPAPPKAADLTAGFHQSVANELAEVAFAGKTTTIFELMDDLRDLAAPALSEEELAAKLPGSEKLTQLLKDLNVLAPAVVFAKKRPVTVAISGDKVNITFPGIRIKDPNGITPPLDIKVSYKTEKTANGFVVVRQGAVQVVSLTKPGADLLTRTHLQLAFNLLFAERLLLAPIPLPAAPGGRTKMLVPLKAQAEDGWAQFSWTLKDK